MQEPETAATGRMDYTGYRAWAAEGARVGALSCLRCGAAVFIDPTDVVDPADIHNRWHERWPMNAVTPSSEPTPGGTDGR